MRETIGRQRRVATKLKAAAAALLAIFAVGALSASGAQASTAGSPIATDFNYVGINVTALGNELNEIVLTPTTEDPANPGNFLPPLHMAGTYNDTAGNFTLPQNGGFDFPTLAVEIGPAAIEAEIGLAAPAQGNYNDATGVMSLNPKISLTLGTDHLEDIEGLPISGTGPLKCQISPLDVSLSTNPVNWPAPGQVFANAASIQNGAIAGSWNTKPKVVAKIPNNAELCPLIGGLLEPVGGLFLANSSNSISNMPTATTQKPAPRPCDPGTTGTPGTPQVDCKVIPPPQCEDGTTGTFPDCVPIIDEPDPVFTVSKVNIAGAKAIKAGKKATLKVLVTNSGDKAGSVKVSLKSSNGKVTLPKSVSLSIPAGKTAFKKFTVKAKKSAKGTAKITAKAAGKTGTTVLKVKKAKKK